MRRLESAGAILTTSESVLFDLVRDSKHAKFKELSSMLKDHNRVENEFAAKCSGYLGTVLNHHD